MKARPEETRPGGFPAHDFACQRDDEGHCPTCADEAVVATVLSIDEESGMACVSLGESEVVVDISLVGAVEPGETVLVHGGVALERLEAGGAL